MPYGVWIVVKTKPTSCTSGPPKEYKHKAKKSSQLKLTYATDRVSTEIAIEERNDISFVDHPRHNTVQIDDLLNFW